MTTCISDLIQAYEDALTYWETVDVNTRDWGGVYDPPSRDAASKALAQAEEALVAALKLVGPVTHCSRDYRVPVAQTRTTVSEAGRQLHIGPAARDAAEVPAP